ncbi:MAG: CaiB/BaiF CoA transferase family protein [Anaerococcus sp.]
MPNKENMLEGLKVVEYANFVAGPCCGRLLADWGADVIKIEPDFGDTMRVVGVQWSSPIEDDENPLFENENAGKRGIVVDARTEEGVQIIYDLVKEADVFLTNTRQKALDKTKLDYETLKEINPGIVYAHLLGYGEKGPAKDTPAFDYTAYFARGGVSLGLMEEGTSPCNPAAAFGDHYAGMSLAAGVLAAVYRRNRTGVGEKVNVSLFHTAIFGMGLYVVAGQYGYKMPISRKEPPNPLNTTFKCSDGKWLQIAFFQYDKWFPKFCNEVINRPEFIGGKYSTLKSSVKYKDEFVPIIEDIFSQEPIDYWCEKLNAVGIPFEKLQRPDELLDDEQCWANDFLFKHKYDNGNEGVLYNTPVMFEEYGIKDFVRAPKKGEHTNSVLEKLGYSGEKIKELKDKKVIN